MYMILFICMSVHVHMCLVSKADRREVRFLELELEVVVSHLVVLGPEPGPSLEQLLLIAQPSLQLWKVLALSALPLGLQ